MADNASSAGEGKEAEEPYNNPEFEEKYPEWRLDFPVDTAEGERNRKLGNRQTPEALITDLQSIMLKEGASRDDVYNFNFNIWQALFKGCKIEGVPDMGNKFDRLPAVAVLRHFFEVTDKTVVEYRYNYDVETKYQFHMKTSDLNTLVAQAKVSSCFNALSSPIKCSCRLLQLTIMGR